MKTYSKLFVTAVVLATLSRGFGQGTFQNLNFESPVLPLTPDGFFQVPIANALPGWQGYLGTFQTDRVVYNTVSLGAAAITLQGPGSSLPILQGSYTVFLQPQFPSGSPIPSLAQTGTVPASAQSIQFYAQNGAWILSFGGNQIPISLLNSTLNYNIYGGDISAFANQIGELRFTGGGYLDSIQFSNQQIPEPSALGLFGFGALLLGKRLRRTVGM